MKEIKCVPVSDYWKGQLKELETPHTKTAMGEITNCVALLHAAELLIEGVENQKIRITKKELLTLASYHYLLQGYHLAGSMLELSKSGYFNTNALLIRSHMEAVIDLAYLWLCKDINGSLEEREAWYLFSEVRRYQTCQQWEEMQKHRQSMGFPLVGVRHLLDEAVVAKLSEKQDEFRCMTSGRNAWAFKETFGERARAVDDRQNFYHETGKVLENLYITSCKCSSGFVHAESLVVPDFTKSKANTLRVNSSLEPEKNQYILALLKDSLFCLVFLFNHINRLGLNLPNQLKESVLAVVS